MTDDEFLQLAFRAGLTKDEMHFEKGLGEWVVSPSGVRKLAAIAPDSAKKMGFMEWFESQARDGWPDIRS
jgi:hypothetical protein